MLDFSIISLALSPLIFFVVMKILQLWKIGSIKKIISDLKTRPFFTAIYQVDSESKRNGGELVASVLKAHGVQEIFTLCGGHISPILVSCQNLGINVFDTRHEATAVFAADAVARLRQSIGVAAVTAGPGVTNTITAMKNAQMAESPVLLIGGAAPTLAKGRGALQDIDQMSLLRPLCKYAARVTIVQDIIPTLREAIFIAQSNTPGPVFVELPIDVIYPYNLVAREAGITPGFGFKNLTDFYLKYHVSRQFSNAWLDQPITPIPVSLQMPTKMDIDKISSILKMSKKPVLLLGSQAMLPPVKPSDLANALEELGVPAFLGGMSRGLMGRKSPLNIRQNRKDALREADCIILAGAICDFRLSYGKNLSKTAKIIAINRNRSQMLKNHGLFWQSSALVQADVASTIIKISEALKLTGWMGASSNWLENLRQADEQKELRNMEKATEPTSNNLLNPLKLLHALEQALPDDTIIVADGGDFVGSAAYILRPRSPLQWLDPGPFGTLGVGGGFALGAKAVYPERPVLIVYGDGASGFSLMEFDTFVRHNLPVISLIGNDAGWNQISREQVPLFGSNVGCQLAYTKYEEIGSGLGAVAELISEAGDEKYSEAELSERLKEMFNRSKEKKQSFVINAIIGRTNFREGSISV